MAKSSIPRHWAVVPAAGAGKRMGSPIPKQYLPLGGITVLEQTLQRLAATPRVAGIVVAISPGDDYWAGLRLPPGCPVHRAEGGLERCHSVANALTLLSGLADPDDWVLVHDAARPCVRRSDIERLISVLSDHPTGGLLGLPVSDTVKRTDAAGEVIATVDRTGLWRALTPQMFRLGELKSALEKAIADGAVVTDEASAMELAGFHPRMVEGTPDNIKITRPGDLEMAEHYLQLQAREGRDP